MKKRSTKQKQKPNRVRVASTEYSVHNPDYRRPISRPDLLSVTRPTRTSARRTWPREAGTRGSHLVLNVPTPHIDHRDSASISNIELSGTIDWLLSYGKHRRPAYEFTK